MFDLILENLKNTGFAMLLFVGAYIANMIFSLWYNLDIVKEEFDKNRILKSVIKIIAFSVGLAVLVTTITAIPLFCDYIGLNLPSEYIDVFTNLSIIGVAVYVSCKYLIEAFQKFTKILGYENPMNKEEEIELVNEEYEEN